jgi:hypothetical protein
MRKPLLAILPLVAVASLTARLALGSCYLVPLDVTIRESEIILIGTVVARDRVEVPGERYRLMETHYRLDDVRYMKGDGPSDSLVLVQTVDYDEPEFRVGERYVICAGRAGANLRAYGCHTPYTVRADSDRGEPVIYKHTSPLIEFSDSTMVWGMRPDWREGKQMEIAPGYFLRRDNGTRVTESEFIETLAGRIRRLGE